MMARSKITGRDGKIVFQGNAGVVVSNTKDGVTLDFYRDNKTVFSITMYNSDCVYGLAGALVKHGCKVFDQKFSEWVERQVLTNKEDNDG
jgi:hypothetical protein